MYALRHWSIRHARALERLYAAVERVLILMAPAFSRIGYERAEAPDSRSSRGTRIPVGFSITPANGSEFTCANGGFGLAHALRVRRFAFTRTEIAILLSLRALCARDSTTSERHARINRLALIGKFYVEEGSRLGANVTQSVNKMREVVRR
jgi:hypothetical protein